MPELLSHIALLTMTFILYYDDVDDDIGVDCWVVIASKLVGFAVWTLNTHPMINLLFIPQSYIIQLYTYETCVAETNWEDEK